jgi:transposase InsO family protein
MREMANQTLLKEIKAVHKASGETYGSPRVYHELKDRIPCSQNRVARLMKRHGIGVKQKRCYKRTTKANENHPVAPNLLDRDFSAAAPNEKWTADITYIPTLEGWLYLAVILDLFSRRVVGWSMSARMTSHLVLDALNMAIKQRRPGPGLLHHSDRGSQYTGTDYQQMLKKQLFKVSMSRTGNCYDNAPTESFMGSLKTEWVHHAYYETRAQARADIFFYIEAFYNRRRRHSTLGYVSPVTFEEAYYSNASIILN